MTARQTSRVAGIADGDIHLPLTAQLAASLLALPEVKVTYRGQALNPQTHITHDVDLDLVSCLPRRLLVGRGDRSLDFRRLLEVRRLPIPTSESSFLLLWWMIGQASNSSPGGLMTRHAGARSSAGEGRVCLAPTSWRVRAVSASAVITAHP
jgi:hypothetical protein